MSIDPAIAPLWAPRAWVDGRWRAQVLLRVGCDGRWAEVSPDTPAPRDARRLSGAVLPGMVNAHSHAFQRAFAGMAERRSGAHDDFWSWRERLYGVALRITPDQLRAVATQLYAELLAGGYTQVCEFHYLHQAPDGSRYADAAEMSRALVDAAQAAGIGLTLLPVLYERAGFAQQALRDDQRRFAASIDDVLRLQQTVRRLGLPQTDAGVAIHSLRAARPGSILALTQALADSDEHRSVPIHIHIAEQTAEVDDCLAATGQRPIAWLCSQVALDGRWHLVHATHALPHEIAAVAARGATVVICPTTEANLGDGVIDLPGWLARDVAASIGSDSHVSRCWASELRLLEYSQRLALRRRNVAAAPELGLDATAARLFDRALAGGAAAAGLDRWGLRVGARADCCVLDTGAAGLLGVPQSHLLDALVFASDAPAFAEVWVAGRRRVAERRHVDQSDVADDFTRAMAQLWASA